MEEENRRLKELLSAAISELTESAEEWYAESLFGDILGTTEEELKNLGVW